MLVSSAFVAAPAQAQNSPGGCTQGATGGPAGNGNRTGRQDSAANLPAVVAVAVQDVAAPITALNLSGTDVNLVCLNDTLNQNDVRVLQDILNGSPILSNNRDNFTHLLQDSTFANGLQIANGVQVVAINLGSPTTTVPTVYLLR